MSPTKRQQTMAKIARERAVKERRAKKEEKKRARKEAGLKPGSDGEDAVPAPSSLDPYAAMLLHIDLSAQEAETLTQAEIATRAADAGVSRLTAERILALERGSDDTGRARAHGQSRPWTGQR